MTCRLSAGRFPALLAALALTGPAVAQPPPPTGFVWTSPSGQAVWRLPLDPVAAPPMDVPLEARAVLPTLPSFDLAMLDGTRATSAQARGKVVVLDFWATWCAPCLKSLPKIQQLWVELRANGLVSIAMNADEPEPVVRDFVERLGLKLPVAFYDDAFSQALRVKTLPTVILVDKAGRVRGRWDGYGAGHELAIGDRIRDLLAEPEAASPPGRRVADVVEGAGSFGVAWATDLPQNVRVSGLSVLRAGAAPARVVVAAGGLLTVLSASDGTVGPKISIPSGGWRLASPRAKVGDVDVVAWRSGSPDLIAVDLDGQRMRPLASPSPVIDVETAGVRMVFATLGGLASADLASGAFERYGEPLPLRSLAAYGEGDARLAVLDDSEKLSWLDASGKAGRAPSATPLYSWGLACPAPDGAVGVVPSTVVATACGSFEEGSKARHAALALRTGDLLVVDLADGRVRFRATWPGIGELAAGDLDGDGTDELIVGAGRMVAALKSAPPKK